MNEIRTYTLTPKKDGLDRAPLIGPYEGAVPLDAQIIYAGFDHWHPGIAWDKSSQGITIDAIVPIANVPVIRQFELVNHGGCCATHLSPRWDTTPPVKVEAPPGLASGRLYLFAEKA